jgi:hypothetical protein
MALNAIEVQTFGNTVTVIATHNAVDVTGKNRRAVEESANSPLVDL